MTERCLYEAAIAAYGEREQSAVAMEECSELIRAINKYHRNPKKENRENLVEEIADVLIMIEQLKIMYKVTDEQIDEAVTMKLLRLFEKLDKEGHIDDKYNEVEE